MNDRKRIDQMDAVRQLAGGIAHDFNNLLTGIMGFVMLVLEDMDENDQAYSYVKEIEKSAVDCREYTGRLIFLSRDICVEKKETDINAVIDAALDEMRGYLGKDVEVSTNMQGAGGLEMDAEKIQGAVACIISDASTRKGDLESMDISGGKIEADERYLEQYTPIQEKGSYFCLRFCARGISISPDAMKTLFRPRFSSGRSRYFGYELAICREIAEKHGGYASVIPRDERTVDYYMWLPVS
ncbi:MAG: hypothetical protein GF409_00200 [Candidatus Omnitrophica bacterium]|nr:hypothetical protein [Candidatus Omnitrophota bacterium]